MPQKRKATMMASSKTQNYHIRDILYILYEDNIYLTNMSLIQVKEDLCQSMELINSSVKPDYIATLKK